jgi:hypothetical protein
VMTKMKVWLFSDRQRWNNGRGLTGDWLCEGWSRSYSTEMTSRSLQKLMNRWYNISTKRVATSHMKKCLNGFFHNSATRRKSIILILW